MKLSLFLEKTEVRQINDLTALCEFVHEFCHWSEGNIFSVIYSTDMPSSIQAAIHSLLLDGDYATIVRKTILAGGCNCSRLCLVGACLGAKYGLGAIPQDWMEKTAVAQEALQLSLQLVPIRG